MKVSSSGIFLRYISIYIKTKIAEATDIELRWYIERLHDWLSTTK